MSNRYDPRALSLTFAAILALPFLAACSAHVAMLPIDRGTPSSECKMRLVSARELYSPSAAKVHPVSCASELNYPTLYYLPCTLPLSVLCTTKYRYVPVSML